MEEDIEILSEMLIHGEDKRQALGNLIKRVKELEALENLIKAYRELEKHNINLSEQLQIAKGGMIIANLDVVEDYIPKLKIKKKIEELKEIADEDNRDEYIKIQAYQELLEEE